ncbi:MAG: hypothetical protein ACOC9W_00065 [Persicimonas sp.]
MVAVKRILVPLAVVALSLGLLGTACGDGGEERETFFLYVTNAYPGADELTLYGPTGKLVSGLPFASRTEEPIEVNRNVNADEFILVLDGAPTEMEFTKPMFSLYPQETGTLVISRRASQESADASLFRHTRSPDPDCVLTFGNSLSLNNALLGDELLSYSYQTEWNVDPRPMYREEHERLAETRCGPTEIPDRYRREDTHDEIAADPWFFPVSSEGDDDLTYTLVWANRRADPRTGEVRSEGIKAGGAIKAVPTTEDFVDCLSGAVTIAEDTDPAGGGDEEAEQKCPSPDSTAVGPDGSTVDVFGEDQVVWNAESAQTCFELFQYTGFPIEPGEPDSSHSFEMYPQSDGDDLVCGSPVRIRTPTTDLIFQDLDENVSNFIDEEGGFVEIDATFPASEHHFFVLFGRPINPFVDQWNSEETSVPLDDYPYPGEVQPGYGDE